MDWQCKKIETSTGVTIYKGLHEEATPSDSDPKWLIYKFTVAGDVTTIQKTNGSWTSRATYF
jgi:hypothetical protein